MLHHLPRRPDCGLPRQRRFTQLLSRGRRQGVAAVDFSHTVAASDSPYTSIKEAAVTVDYPFRTITHYPGIPGTLHLKRTVRMRTALAVPKADN